MSEQLDLFAVIEPPTAIGAPTPADPPDVAARKLVVDDLGRTLFVSAGAGSGKTTALIGRIVNLVLSGVAITEIAAVTFTEDAAGRCLHARDRA